MSQFKGSILLAIDDLSGGGAEAVVIRLAQSFSEQGYDTHIAIFADRVDYEVPHNVTLHILNKYPKGKPVKEIYYSLAASELKKRIQSLGLKFDMIIANLPLTHRILMRAKLENVHYCIHNSYYTVYVAPKKGSKRKTQIRKFQRRFKNKSLVFVSEGTQAELINKIGVRPKQQTVIYNPFPIEQIQERSGEPIENLDQLGTFFLHAARFSHQKRHDRLLELYKQSGVTDKLVLIGTGPADKEQAIREQIARLDLEDQVVLLGFQSNPYKYMRAAKALLLCSDNEGLPTVIIEALITGCPVISLDCPSGPAEILSPGLSDYLFAMDDLDGFARKMAEVSKQAPRVSYESARLDRFDHNAVARRYLELIT